MSNTFSFLNSFITFGNYDISMIVHLQNLNLFYQSSFSVLFMDIKQHLNSTSSLGFKKEMNVSAFKPLRQGQWHYHCLKKVFNFILIG